MTVSRVKSRLGVWRTRSSSGSNLLWDLGKIQFLLGVSRSKNLPFVEHSLTQDQVWSSPIRASSGSRASVGTDGECVVRGRSEGLVRQGKQRKRSVFFLILSHNSSSLNVLFKEKGRDKKGEITIK